MLRRLRHAAGLRMGNLKPRLEPPSSPPVLLPGTEQPSPQGELPIRETEFGGFSPCHSTAFRLPKHVSCFARNMPRLNSERVAARAEPCPFRGSVPRNESVGDPPSDPGAGADPSLSRPAPSISPWGPGPVCPEGSPMCALSRTIEEDGGRVERKDSAALGRVHLSFRPKLRGPKCPDDPRDNP